MFCELKEKKKSWDFPGGPVVKTLHFHCREQVFGSLVRELRSLHAMCYGQKKEKILVLFLKFLKKKIHTSIKHIFVTVTMYMSLVILYHNLNFRCLIK